MDYGHSNLELLARPMLDTNQAGNAELDTDPSEQSALMANGRHMEHLPCSGPLEHSVLEMKWRNDNLELEDAIRLEVLRSRSMGCVSACDVNGLLLSP